MAEAGERKQWLGTCLSGRLMAAVTLAAAIIMALRIITPVVTLRGVLVKMLHLALVEVAVLVCQDLVEIILPT